MKFPQYYAEKSVYRKISRGRIKGILALAGDLDDKTVLDIGCGGGELGKELKGHFSKIKVYGIDISPQAVKVAKQYLDGAEVLDLTELWPESFFNTKFDLVVASEVLEHLFNPEEVLIKIRKQFSCPVILTVPNVLFWKNRLKILLGHFTYTETGLMDRGHIHFFNWQSFNKTIVESGYQVETNFNHYPTRGTRFLGRIWPGLFAFQFIVKIIPSGEKLV